MDDALEHYAFMLIGEHDPERIKKVVDYLEEHIKDLHAQIEKCEKLKEIANKRLANG